MVRCTAIIYLVATIVYVFGQDYQAYDEYAEGYQDNLYADYAMRQQEKKTVGGGYVVLAHVFHIIVYIP